MGNFGPNNYNKYDLQLSKQNYYDFDLNYDYNHEGCNTMFTDIDHPCLITHFDFNNSNIFLNGDTNNKNTIYSLRYWEDAVNNGVDVDTYGLTGLDNGVVTLGPDLLDTFLNSNLNILSGDTRLFLNRVTGYTNNYNYNLEYVETGSPQGNHMIFKGGFYQGYYKLDGYDYEVLPNRYSEGNMISIWLNKDDSVLSGSTDSILNDTYPNNKGFFLYFGTRAENKFWNQFSGNTSGDCSGSTSNFCTNVKETDILLTLDNGYNVPLSPPAIVFEEITNQFLIYGRATYRRCDSGRPYDGLGVYTVCDFNGDETPTITISGYTYEKISNSPNPFLIYGRSQGRRCDSGRAYDGLGADTVCSYSGNTLQPLTELDIDADVIDNALGFRVRDDGAIGYRYLSVTGTCINNSTVTGVTINEEYTTSGLVTNGNWTNITIRWVPYNILEGCELETTNPRKGKLMIYVGCFLKHVFKDFPEFVARRLNNLKEKQLGVPFNISLGGGSQGLLESITLDGQDLDDLGHHIEKNFAGTFIGAISQFKIYNCNMSWCFIKSECENNADRYGDDQNCYMLDEEGNYILQEDGISKIILEDC